MYVVSELLCLVVYISHLIDTIPLNIRCITVLH